MSYGRKSVFPIPSNAHYYNTRQDWLGILDGDRSAAAVLDVLAGWATSVLDSPRFAGKPIPDSVNIGRRTLQHIEQYLFGSIRERAIKNAIVKLKDAGFIDTKTAIAKGSEFIIHIRAINEASGLWAETQAEIASEDDDAGRNCPRTQAEIASIAGRNCLTSYIPKDLSKEGDKESPSLSRFSKAEPNQSEPVHHPVNSPSSVKENVPPPAQSRNDSGINASARSDALFSRPASYPWSGDKSFFDWLATKMPPDGDQRVTAKRFLSARERGLKPIEDAYDYWEMYQELPKEKRRSQSSAPPADGDWRNHPQFEEWRNECMTRGASLFIFPGGKHDATREAFVDWGAENGIFEVSA